MPEGVIFLKKGMRRGGQFVYLDEENGYLFLFKQSSCTKGGKTLRHFAVLGMLISSNLYRKWPYSGNKCISK